MACFVAPTTAAIVATGIKKKIPAKYHLDWLNAMLWGGSVMLVVEHIAHGEVVFSPPFLTAMKNPAEIPAMLEEIVTVGSSMTLAILIVWAAMVYVANTALVKQLKSSQSASA